ncbi:hypothetical protein CERSUDRAFT_52171 [Gelatoporia subvermispora B]|uniref:Uncharacterized protein n=1 Tax=Ceriporiopsis subvermispora (strain B) TaxID=914234 RepID=M2QVQ9_CERS8|nr:hypothetical protein CERSUDRAFT_52171 [Gelatoporia subvermispora B]
MVDAISAPEVRVHLAYAEQQRLDGSAAVATQAAKRKAVFDRRVHASQAGAVSFATGDLVQVYRNDLDYTFHTEHKLLPKWSPPRRIAGR